MGRIGSKGEENPEEEELDEEEIEDIEIDETELMEVIAEDTKPHKKYYCGDSNSTISQHENSTLIN